MRKETAMAESSETEQREWGLYDGVSLVRGLGYSGRRVKIIETPCEVCGYDRIIKKEYLHPEAPPDVEYFCQHPNCPDYHNDKLGMPRL